MTQLGDLPNELLFQIADYVDTQQQDPLSLLSLMYTCRTLYVALRPRLYHSIYCFVSFDEEATPPVEELRQGQHHKGQVLITRSEPFVKLMALLSSRDDLLELVQHLSCQTLNFQLANKFVSNKLGDAVPSSIPHNSKPLNFYTHLSEIHAFTPALFGSFVQGLQTHIALERANKKFLAEHTLVMTACNEKTDLQRSQMVTRMLFCPFDFKSFDCKQQAEVVDAVVQALCLGTTLRDAGRDVHLSVMNLQNAMVQSSFSHCAEEENDPLMKLNVMHYYL